MFNAILLGIGLAMDASAVSIVNGIKYQNYTLKNIFISSFVFGIFQGIMPLLGYFVFFPFLDYVDFIDHWIVFIILSVLGIKMIIDGLKKEEMICEKCEIFSKKILLAEAIATSIDALSVGLSLPFLVSGDIYIACLIIGVVTTFMCLIACVLGNKLGLLLRDKAVALGGIILIVIGFKTLLEHLL